MRFLFRFRAPYGKTKLPVIRCFRCQNEIYGAGFPRLQFQKGRSFSSSPVAPSFGIAFDVDGVILRGTTPIGGSPAALRRLYNESGALKIPFLFLTNGGGIPESKRAYELGKLLGVNILPLQVVQGHSPFKELANRFENELIVAVGKGEPAGVMSEYGFKKVLSIDEYASYFDDIDPLSVYKTWGSKKTLDRKEMHPRYDVFSEKVQAAFVVSDPVDWGRDIQVLCDILRCSGLPGGKSGGSQPPLFFASDDLKYQVLESGTSDGQHGFGEWNLLLHSGTSHVGSTSIRGTFTVDMFGYLGSFKYLAPMHGYPWISYICELIFKAYPTPIRSLSYISPPSVSYFLKTLNDRKAVFPSERLGMGAFRIALESIFNRIHHDALSYTSFGKPNPFVFKNAEAILKKLRLICSEDLIKKDREIKDHPFKKIYMVGDNPSVDIQGAQKAGHPWFSILTRTGVFKGSENDSQIPADLVVDTVEEAVDYILQQEHD